MMTIVSMPRRIASGLGFAAFAGALASGPHASADPPTPPAPPVINLDEDFVIEARAQKPEAFYFLRRTPFGYVIRSLDQDFVHEIVRAVGGDEF